MKGLGEIMPRPVNIFSSRSYSFSVQRRVMDRLDEKIIKNC